MFINFCRGGFPYRTITGMFRHKPSPTNERELCLILGGANHQNPSTTSKHKPAPANDRISNCCRGGFIYRKNPDTFRYKPSPTHERGLCLIWRRVSIPHDCRHIQAQTLPKE